MSNAFPGNQPPSRNPYSAPKSAAASYAKSYLTLVLCSSIAIASVLAGTWFYLQSTEKDSYSAVHNKGDEDIDFSRRALPYERPDTGNAPATSNAPAIP